MIPYGPLGSLFGSSWHPMVPYGPLWSCMIPYGPLWSFMVPSGRVWSRMVLYGSVVVLYGPIWSCMVPYGPVWSRMVPYPTCPKKDKLPACPKKDQLPTCPEKQVDLVLSHGFHKSPQFFRDNAPQHTAAIPAWPQSFLKYSINSQKVIFRCSSESFSFIEVNPL